MTASRTTMIAGISVLALAITACGGDDEATESSVADSGVTESPVADSSATESSEATESSAADSTVTSVVNNAATTAVGCEGVDLSQPPAEPITIRLGHGSGTEEPLYLMKIAADEVGSQYQGEFYNLELTEFSPPDRLAAYQAGELDGGTISTPQLFTAVGNGIDIMAATSVATVSGSEGFTYPYAALEGGKFGPGSDLKGAKIGIIAPNTATEYWAKSAVAAQGLDPERDVSYVAIPPPNSEQALRDGQVDIQMFISDFWGIAEQTGGVVEVFNALTGPGFDHELLDIFFSRGFVADNPAAYCAWRADYVAAVEAFTADREAFGQVLIDEGYDAAPDAAAFNARQDAGRADGGVIDLANVQLMIDDMKEIGFLPEDLDVEASDLVMDGYSLVE